MGTRTERIRTELTQALEGLLFPSPSKVRGADAAALGILHTLSPH